MTPEDEAFRSIARGLGGTRKSSRIGAMLGVLGAFSLPAGFITWLLIGDWRWTLAGLTCLLGCLIAAGYIDRSLE